MEERKFVDAHGVEVFTRWWPVDDAVGVVLIAHGASEHSGRYDRFARALNDAGYAAAALDQRGHGHTGSGTGAGRTGDGGGQAVLDDIGELRSLVPEVLGAGAAELPTFLFGHSLGSAIAFGYLGSHSEGLAGAILSGVPVDVTQIEAMAEMLGGLAEMRDESAGPILAANNEPFEPARTPFDWLSRDEAEVDLYLADPYCGDQNPITYGFLIDLLEVVAPAAKRLDAISCPVLIVAGDQDPAAGMGTHPTAASGALQAAGVETELRLYPDARHELLNETNRDEVTADILAWLTQRT